MAFSQDQLNALESAIAQGALSVRFADRTVTYHSLGEMLKLRDTMRAELGVSTPTTARSRIINIPTGKGL
jgi:hypothetical protein